MKVRDVMSSPVFVVRPDASFAEVVDEMLDHDVSGVPVVDADGAVLGIVSEADLIANDAYGYRRHGVLGFIGAFMRDRDPQWFRKAAARTARELMTSAPSAVAPNASLSAVAQQMLEEHHKRVPVVDDGRLVGIVTRHDLLHQFHRADDELLDDIQRVLADEWRVPTTHEATVSVKRGIVTLEGNAQFPDDVRMLESVVGKMPGVIAVENHLIAREPALH